MGASAGVLRGQDASIVSKHLNVSLKNIDGVKSIGEARRSVGTSRALLRVATSEGILEKLAWEGARTLIGVFQEHDPSIFDKLCRVFRRIDADGSGGISVSELGKVLRESGAPANLIPDTFLELDMNNDHRISEDEFLRRSKCSGLLSYVCWSRVQPSADQIRLAAEVFLRTFRKWKELMTLDIAERGLGPGIDSESLDALTHGKINALAVRGNSRCFWDTDGGMILMRDEIVRAVASVVGIRVQREEEEKTSTAVDVSTGSQLKAGGRVVLGYLVRLTYEIRGDQNVGAIVLKNMFDPKGQPIVLFRSQAMVDVDREGSCFRNLLADGGGRVRHVHSIYAGHFPVGDLLDSEKSICAQLRKRRVDERGEDASLPSFADARSYRVPRKWRRLVEKPSDWENPDRVSRAMAICASQILSILRPNGHPPKGNILVHCCGGMHRTGMIVGIIRRYVNGDPIEDIIADYKRHVDWRSHEQPGGYEDLNEKFIREFDLSLFDRPPMDIDMSDQDRVPAGGFDEWGHIAREGRCGGRGFFVSVPAEGSGGGVACVSTR